ncbi:MAG: M1 family metallopeptidase [Reichenbachiella sp.]|uniref:M1 family metallopeptidase n=1 Tax=Reichenbachiella sp. TaxID=2184521 RepID=UPI003296E3E1
MQNENMLTRGILGLSLVILGFAAIAQPDRWQQRVEYKMEIDMDVVSNQFTGVQQLKYYNNSPDTLDKVFYHLYFNAFQPGSMMDVRSRTHTDTRRGVQDRIFKLKEDEIGYHKIKSFRQDGKRIDTSVDGTIMTARLSSPILPGQMVVFEMEFESQVPIQIRRNGRDNKEGIRYSMGQWFPKIAEYDYSGWHSHDYIGREFYSPWGDYDVTIDIDSDYVVAASGVLQSSKNSKNGKKTTHRYLAENVHDFAWGADPDYKHDVVKIREGLDFHVYYQGDTLVEQWEELGDYMKKAIPFIEAKCGKYPFPVYKVVQGGDGGMEYPMFTLMTGHKPLKSVVGTAVHEFLHSYYQLVLGTNESYLYWMDEGFDQYYDEMTMNYLFDESFESRKPMAGYYRYYKGIVESGKEEPLTTHADHFENHRAYGMAAYGKGALALQSLEYILGREVFDRAMLRYYNTWKFKHPNAVDFEIIMEKESGLVLNWFFDYWTKTTKTIDYAVQNVSITNDGSQIEMERIGLMPMPLDVVVTLVDGSKLNYHIPLGMTRGNRPLDEGEVLMSAWKWVNPYYSFVIDIDKDQIESVAIDPSRRMVDINYENNIYPNRNSELEIKGKSNKLENN